MAVSFVSVLSEAQRNKVYLLLLAEGDLEMGMGFMPVIPVTGGTEAGAAQVWGQLQPFSEALSTLGRPYLKNLLKSAEVGERFGNHVAPE